MNKHYPKDNYTIALCGKRDVETTTETRKVTCKRCLLTLENKGKVKIK